VVSFTTATPEIISYEQIDIELPGEVRRNGGLPNKISELDDTHAKQQAKQVYEEVIGLVRSNSVGKLPMTVHEKKKLKQGCK
jgi:hypothetical protein